MKRLNILLIILVILWIAGVYYWINEIEDMYMRVLGILIVSVLAYGIGRIHRRKLNPGEKEIEARIGSGDSDSPEPSFN